MEQHTNPQIPPQGEPVPVHYAPQDFTAASPHQHLDETGLQEKSTFWRDPTLGDLELLRATYITHAFAPHTHEGYAIGVIDQGAERFKYRRAIHVAPQGSIVVVHPGEMHTGEALSKQGWSYRMLYPDSSLLQRSASDIVGRHQALPFFSSPVIHDPIMAQLLSP